MSDAKSVFSGPVAVAGATGHAGLAIVRSLLTRGVPVRALVRSPAKLAGLEGPLEVRRVELTEPGAIRGCLDGASAVVSALGKTTQRGGAPRRLVDVDTNLALIEEAKRVGVAKLGFVSVAMARPDHPVTMVAMKGEVEQAIEASGLPHIIVQPTGYFSDMWQLLEMSKKGTFWIVGDGKMRFNPIDPRDVAELMVARLLDEKVTSGRFPAGGPEIFDSFGLAELCAEVLGRRVRVRRVPLWLARSLVAAVRPFSEDLWQMADFFVGNVAYAKRELGDEASLPIVGDRRLSDYFRAGLEAEKVRPGGDGERRPEPLLSRLAAEEARRG